jgi:hypothetical protein
MWFQSLAEANRRFPQGDSILDFVLAHTFFSSIANGEMSPQEALTSSMTDEQAIQLLAKANRFHKRFNVASSDFHIDVEDIHRVWTNRLLGFKELIHETVATPNIPVLDKTIFLFQDPSYSTKADMVLRLSRAAELATQSPESIVAAAQHRQRAKEDVSYRRTIGQPTALIPVFESVKTATEAEAILLMDQKGIVVPQPVMDWFTRGREWALMGQLKRQ